MSDPFEDKRRAHEEEFFKKQNEEALAKLKKKKALLCPVDSEPLTSHTSEASVFHRCPNCGGIWSERKGVQQLIAEAEASNGKTLDLVKSLLADRS